MASSRPTIDHSGEIDRKKLGELVFIDPSLRKQLNAATHPLVTLELALRLLWHWLLFHFVVVRLLAPLTILCNPCTSSSAGVAGRGMSSPMECRNSNAEQPQSSQSLKFGSTLKDS